MGWMRTIMLGEIGNRLDLNDVEDDIRRMRTRQRQNLEAVKQQVQALEAETDQLRLCIAALVRLLDQRQVIPRADLTAMIDRIDREDGKPDGRTGGPLV
jgi:hypothetical protein